MDPFGEVGATFRFANREDVLLFLSCFRSTKSQNITRLALEHFTNPFQGIESDSLRLVLLQSPQRRMTYAGLFSQPIKGALVLFQQLVDSDSDHCNAKPPEYMTLLIMPVKYLSIEYIAFLTYMPACYSLPFKIESS